MGNELPDSFEESYRVMLLHEASVNIYIYCRIDKITNWAKIIAKESILFWSNHKMVLVPLFFYFQPTVILAWQANDLSSPNNQPLICCFGSQEKSLNLHPRNHRFMTKKTFMCRYTPLILLLCYYIVMLHYEDGGDGGTLDSRLCEIKIMNRERRVMTK